MTFSFRMYWGINYKCLVSTIHMYYMYLSCIEHFATAGFYRFIGQFCRLEKGTILHALLSKTYTGIISTNFNTQNYVLFKISTSDLFLSILKIPKTSASIRYS